VLAGVAAGSQASIGHALTQYGGASAQLVNAVDQAHHQMEAV
jgi:hypothetical protein